MPELPEVETVRRGLVAQVIGRKIVAVEVRCSRIVQKRTPSEFEEALIGETFRAIRRYGKYLLFDLDHVTLVSHLRMEGKFYLHKTEDDFTKHDHVIFTLDDQRFLCYNDVRKFGTMTLVPLHEEDQVEGLRQMGREANDKTLTPEAIYPLIHSSNRAIKSILLDQTVIAGLGNIYVDETLFLAKIHPQRKGRSLNIYHVRRILSAARQVLDKAVDLGGTTIRTYQSAFGIDGRFQNELNVHTRVNEPCPVCGDTIIKIKVGGRGTYLCPTCQREGHMQVIGLTGGIATGKTTVTQLFEKKRVKIIDADKIYKNLLKNNKIMYNEIVQNFGQEIVSDGQIDRQKLGRIIFSDPIKRDLLNHTTHPFVLEEIKDMLNTYRKRRVKMVVIDIPLLYETHLEHWVDLVILVYAPKAVQIRRLMERDGLKEKDALQRVEAQMDIEIKKTKADIVIDNSMSIEHTTHQFQEIYRQLRSDTYVNR